MDPSDANPTRRVSLKAAMTTVPLSPHTYLANLPSDHCLGSGENAPRLKMNRLIDNHRSCSRRAAGVCGSRCRATALQHHPQTISSAPYLRPSPHLLAPRRRRYGQSGDQEHQARREHVDYSHQSEPEWQGLRGRICAVRTAVRYGSR